ncbi:MAG: hypothetical protein LBB85_02780, partial [Dysgonamonadaceae bacterium]|nr:hypothetical protein [Dysgonamonadaceae bacterium]
RNRRKDLKDVFDLLCLRQYGDFDYLKNHWWALHIQNPFGVAREMFAVCRKWRIKMKVYHGSDAKNRNHRLV